MPRWADLDPAFAIDLPVDLASDGDVGGGQACRDARLFFDDDRALTLDLALNRPEQPHGAFGLERALEARVLANQAFNVDVVNDRTAGHPRSGQADIDVGCRRAEARTGAALRRDAASARRRTHDGVVRLRRHWRSGGFVAILRRQC